MTEASERTDGSRTDMVLDPAFLDGVKEAPTEEVRRRRDETLAEREFQSYLRRLVQVRQDILAAELARRKQGADPQPIVERLTSVLAQGNRAGGTRGEALRTAPSDADLEEAQRQVDAMMPDVSLSAPQDLTDEDLDRALTLLSEAEHAVSSRRAAVMRVHDRLQEELKGRYREHPEEIPREM